MSQKYYDQWNDLNESIRDQDESLDLELENEQKNYAFDCSKCSGCNNCLL